MKQKEHEIYFKIKVDEKIQEVRISAEELRNCIKEAKLKKDVEELSLQLVFDNKTVNVPMKMSDIKMLLKQSMLLTGLVPRSLEPYLQDLSQKLSQKPISPIVGREHELEKIWFYISQKNRNNVFIIGDTEVGKTAIAQEIARQVATDECPKEFYKKRVLLLRPEAFFKLKSDYAFESAVKKVVNFLVENRKSIVLYIDNALYMKTDEYLIMMLYACIKKYNIPMIATLSVEDYEQYFLADTNLAKYLNDVYIEEPEYKEIAPMLKSHIELFEKRYKIKISDEIVNFAIYTSELSEAPSLNPGKTISILEKAFLEARRKGKKEVDKKSILSCYNTYLKMYEKENEKSIEATSYHETGHYIVQIKSKNQNDMKIACVSILPMMDWMGVNIPYRDGQEFGIYSKEYFIDQIAIYIAGRIAEKKFTNTESAGASSDLQYANSYAKAIIMNWGFSDKEGNKNRSYTLEDYYLMPESKKELIDKEIQELIDAGTKRAQEIIDANEGLLKVIAERLVVDEILTGEQLEQICKEYEEQKNK